MRKFAQPINNSGKFNYILNIIKQYTPFANPLFHETLANIFIYETQDIPLDKIVKQPGDYKTRFGITSPFLTDLVTRGLPRTPGGAPEIKSLAGLSQKEIKMLESIRNKTLINNSYDPAGLDLESAVLAAYFGVWKKLSLDSLIRFPNVIRVLFDFAFNAGAERTARYFKIVLNKKAEEIVNDLNVNIKNQIQQSLTPTGLSVLSQLVKSTNLPKERMTWNPDNTIAFKKLPITSTIIPGDGSLKLLSYIVNTGLVTEPEVAMGINNLRINFHKTKSPAKFREGLLNRVRSYNEMLASKTKNNEGLLKALEQWRSNPKTEGFHRYMIPGKGG